MAHHSVPCTLSEVCDEVVVRAHSSCDVGKTVEVVEAQSEDLAAGTFYMEMDASFVGVAVAEEIVVLVVFPSEQLFCNKHTSNVLRDASLQYDSNVLRDASLQYDSNVLRDASLQYDSTVLRDASLEQPTWPLAFVPISLAASVACLHSASAAMPSVLPY